MINRRHLRRDLHRRPGGSVADQPSSGAINNRGDVLELVRNQLAEILEIEPDGINESSSFADDLNADSLA